MSLRIVKRQTTYWDLAGCGRSLRVHFLDKQEHCFVQAEVQGQGRILWSLAVWLPF